MDIKTEYNTKWKNIIYLTCLSIYVISFTLVSEAGLLKAVPVLKWEQYDMLIRIIHIILAVKIFGDIVEEPEIIPLIGLTAAIGWLSYSHNPVELIVPALWFLCAGRSVNARKTTQCLFWSYLFSFCLIQILCAAGVLSFGKMVKSGHTKVSYSLGFSHPNMAGAAILQLVLLFWILRKGRLTVRHYLGIIVITVATKIITDCGTVVLLLILLLICTVLYNIHGVTQFLYEKITLVRNLVIAAYVGVIGATTAFFCLCKTTDFTALGTFGSRIIQSVKYYRYYGFSLWGQTLMYYKTNPEETKKAGLYTLDNGYMYLLLGLGTILFLYFIFLQAGSMWWFFKRKRLDYIIVLGIYFVYGFLETQVIRTSMNFTLFYLFGFMWEYYDSKRDNQRIPQSGQ